MRTLLAMMMLAATVEAAPLARPLTPAARLPPVDVTRVPSTCTSIAHQANAQRVASAQAARLALAQCIATARMAEVQDLIDSQVSMEQLETSVETSVALLDGAIASEDPALVLEAQDAKGRLYVQLATRMLTTVPALPAAPADDAMRLHDQRVALLATWLQPWRDRAHEAFTGAIAIGREYQGPIAKDPVAAAALSNSKRAVAAP